MDFVDDARMSDDDSYDVDTSVSSLNDDFDLDSISSGEPADSMASDEDVTSNATAANFSPPRKRRRVIGGTALRGSPRPASYEVLFAEQPSLLMQLVPILIVCLFAVLGISMGISSLGHGMGLNIGGGSGAYLRLEGQ